MTEAILREGGDRLEPRLREDVRLIDGAMEEALDLVNDHLDLARLAAGREIVRVTEVHVDELFSALRGIVVHLPRSPARHRHLRRPQRRPHPAHRRASSSPRSCATTWSTA